MDDWNNEHSMVFRCEAARKANETRPRRSRRHANLSRFRDAAIRDAWRGAGIIAGERRKRAVAVRGTAAASEAKSPRSIADRSKAKVRAAQNGDFVSFSKNNPLASPPTDGLESPGKPRSSAEKKDSREGLRDRTEMPVTRAKNRAWPSGWYSPAGQNRQI